MAVQRNNILLIRPFTSMTIMLTNNSDWRDAIMFMQSDNVTPLDITGIDFYANLRETIDGVNLLLNMSTENGYLINMGFVGVLQWNIPASVMKEIPVSTKSYVMDIVAIQGEYTVNLFPTGPAQVFLSQGVTVL